jgi:hypothetical protein
MNAIRFKTEGVPPFLTIERACEVTGLSQYFLRSGCKDGSVPCIKSGRVYMVNIPALLRKLGAEGGEIA